MINERRESKQASRSSAIEHLARIKEMRAGSMRVPEGAFTQEYQLIMSKILRGLLATAIIVSHLMGLAVFEGLSKLRPSCLIVFH